MVNRVKKMARISGGISECLKHLLGKNISRAISGGAVEKVNAASDAYASPNPIPGYRKGGRVNELVLQVFIKVKLC
jgi:hypothetical protein